MKDLFDPPPKQWTSTEMVDLIRQRYPRLSHAVLEQVGNTTGYRCNRHADVVVLELWPSDGLHLMGFEVKVSRGDWRRELADPDKADAIARYCDTWWVVAPPDVVGPSELRPGWGLLEPRWNHPIHGLPPYQLRKRVGARQADPRPTLDRGFVAAVLRAATKLP